MPLIWKGKLYRTYTKSLYPRNFVIGPNLLNKRIFIHNGYKKRSFIVSSLSLYKKAGSFFFTKKRSQYLKAKKKKKKYKQKSR